MTSTVADIGHHRCRHLVASTSDVAGQQHCRKNLRHQLFPRRIDDAPLTRRHDMSLLIEDLARDRMRQVQRDNERVRQVRQARAARRAARI